MSRLLGDFADDIGNWCVAYILRCKKKKFYICPLAGKKTLEGVCFPSFWFPLSHSILDIRSGTLAGWFSEKLSIIPLGDAERLLAGVVGLIFCSDVWWLLADYLLTELHDSLLPHLNLNPINDTLVHFI